jgi:lysozyme
LALVRYSEGTAQASDPWRCCYAFKHTIVDLRDHPVLTGEWSGEPLPDHMCVAAGITPPCRSTAAGAYQFTKPTWLRLKAALCLTDFGHQSQDDAALEDIKSVGALALINAGRIVDAIQACRIIWASLPGNPAHQPQRTLAELIDAYGGAGGLLA